MNLVLKRTIKNPKETLGTLTCIGELVCYTCELPWNNNEVRNSCIPTGTYKVVRRKSPKYGAHFHVTGVPGRSLILIHIGNTARDTKGCLLPGLKLKTHWVEESREAMEKLQLLIPAEGCTLTIE